MIRRQFAALLLLFALLVPTVALAQQPQTQQPQLDPNDPIAKIRDEGLNRSQAMQTLSYLSDVIGPRLTASPGMKRANEWTRDTLTKWGLQNAHLEAWGPFGRGWSLKRFSAQVTDPLDFPLIAYPKAWSPATNGPISADVVYFDAKDEADMARFKGQLKGKIVLTQPLREVKALGVRCGQIGVPGDRTTWTWNLGFGYTGENGFGGRIVTIADGDIVRGFLVDERTFDNFVGAEAKRVFFLSG